VSENHDDIAARLRDEAGATAPQRLRADVMLRVRAEPRPQRLRPRRTSFGRSFATVAAAACILGAMVFGLSRVDFGGSSSSSGAGATRAAENSSTFGGAGGGVVSPSAPVTSYGRSLPSRADQLGAAPNRNQALRASAVPRPLRAAILGRYNLATPIRDAFGAIDPHHGSARR